MSNKKQFDYKWIIAGLCFLMIFFGLGFFSSTRSLFIAPISNALGITRGTFSLTDTFRFLSTSVTNLFFGVLVTKFGAKKLIAVGFLSLCAAALCFSFASNVVLCYLAGVLMGIGFSFGSTTIVSYVINHWFSEKKGSVMGVILAANGIGGAVGSQVIAPIIAAHAGGFRDAYRFLALLFFAMAVLLTILFKDKPHDAVTLSKNSKRRGRDWVGIPFSEALRSWYFYGIALCIFLSGIVLQGVFGVMGAHLSDVGFSTAFVTNVLSIHSLFMTVSKVLTGIVYDKFGLRAAATTCSVAAIVTGVLFAILTPTPTGMVMAIVFSVLSSFAMPLETIVVPLYAADLFGQKSFDHILGIFISVNTAGYALASPIINLCYDAFGSYSPAVLISCSSMAVITVLLQFVISAAHKKQREIENKEKALI